jgi:hypothetical protein
MALIERHRLPSPQLEKSGDLLLMQVLATVPDGLMLSHGARGHAPQPAGLASLYRRASWENIPNVSRRTSVGLAAGKRAVRLPTCLDCGHIPLGSESVMRLRQTLQPRHGYDQRVSVLAYTSRTRASLSAADRRRSCRPAEISV